MTKSSILQYLKQYVRKELQTGNYIDKKAEKIFTIIESAAEEDIILGDCPNYFCAYMECNSTGVGTSYFEGTTTQRTVALDYTTDQYLFIDGHEGAAVKGLEIFYLKEGETINYYRKDSIRDLADMYGSDLHIQNFRDLNFLIKSHRLNRYTVKVTKGPFSYPIHPIFLASINKEHPTLVGYVYTIDETDYIIVDFKDVEVERKKRSWFSPWMLLGFFFPPLFIVALFVIFYRISKQD